MRLSKETVYDLENFYDRIADEDEELVDKQFTKLQPLHQDLVKKNNYKKDEIDDKLVSLFVQTASSRGIEEKWAKGYLFYEYFDNE
ncbi:hypothetical protein [Tumebacillus flagellatus]|uniref:Uncharacterized protein n=1 Tax=Tumebacillus flagellatus TaxID=1157490 RepID=A0A074LIB8_9BACL|nr:hypothetical protein [Tumebacillus flagellatus]KEO80884.1 hypothetical protein EL26_23855 [Tumebacillus flagellatus]